MIQVINRAIDILEFVSKDRNKEFRLSEIADNLELNHGTCANIIKTLLNRGYLEQTYKKQGYKIGYKAYYLTGNYSNKKELLKIAAKPIKKLNEKLNESCILAITKDNMRVTILKKMSTHELQVVDNSEEKNIYVTATGRVALACLSRQEQKLFIQKYGLPGEKWKEVNNEAELLEELDKIKEKQLAIHFDDSHVVGVGAPIYKDNKVIASIGVYLPVVRFNYKLQELIFSEISKTAKKISKGIEKIGSDN